MNTITIGILAPVITFLIGRYFRANTAKFQLVANKDKHPAANDNYLYVEGEINGSREAGLLKLSDWSKAKERLLKNPEDKPNHE
jgi:hypothetical protein